MFDNQPDGAILVSSKAKASNDQASRDGEEQPNDLSVDQIKIQLCNYAATKMIGLDPPDELFIQEIEDKNRAVLKEPMLVEFSQENEGSTFERAKGP